MACPHWLVCPTGMSNVKWRSIWLMPEVDAGSVPSIHSTDLPSTLSTSCRPAAMVTVGLAGGAPPGFPLFSAPIRFSHFTKVPGLVDGTLTATLPVKGWPLGGGFVLFGLAFGSHWAVPASAPLVFSHE